MPRPPERRAQAMDPMTAYQMIHILEGVVQRGTAVRLRSMDRPLFGKTGTKSGPTNDWFVGDRTSVVSGKSVSVRVDIGGRRLIQQKTRAVERRHCTNGEP